MGTRSCSLILLLAFWASFVVFPAQSTRVTEHFDLFGSASNASCANVDCQQGTCVPNDNILVSLLFPYKCNCNPGWTTLGKVMPLLEVPSLPCNVPNCSLNVGCGGSSPAGAPSSSTPITSANTTACLIPGICGHGTCKMIPSNTTLLSFKCVCDPGYANVLNTTGGYCVSNCEMSGGCQNLNLAVPSPPGSSSDQSANSGCRGSSLNRSFFIADSVAVGWALLFRR